jgi:hypothetical protein
MSKYFERLGALVGLLIFCILWIRQPAQAVLSRVRRQEFDRAMSKWVARDSTGRYFLIAVEPQCPAKSVLTLRVARGASASSLADFFPPVELAWAGSSQDPVFAAGMVIDRQNNLHLVWNTRKGLTSYSWIALKQVKDWKELGDRRLWRKPGSTQPGKLILAQAGSRLGDIVLGPEGGLWVAWTTQQGDHQVTVNLGEEKEDLWRSFRMAEGYGLAPPSLLIDGQGDFHLAWHDIYEDLFYLRGQTNELGSGKRWEARELVGEQAYPRLHRPAMAVADGQTVAVSENDLEYLEYLFPDEDHPTPRSLTRRDARFSGDSMHSPQFAIDRYGIPWLFFIDSARQHVFYTRSLGTEWSPFASSYWLTRNSPRMADNHLAIDRLAVEPQMSATEAGIGVAIANESEFPEVTFHTLEVPSLEAKAGKKVLFLDLLELKAMDGLELQLNEAKKYAGNPVIRPGGPTDFDSLRAGDRLTVLKENGVYRMWYSATHLPKEFWPNFTYTGYAESSDGLSFHKPNLGLASFHGNSNTSLIPDLGFVLGVYYDPHDPNPEHRYKVLKFRATVMADEEARKGLQDPWSDTIRGTLFTSADGIHWKGEPADIQFPSGRGGTEVIPESLFYDAREKDPAKKYKAYGYSSLNRHRRGPAYLYSPDAVHWTAYEQDPVLDPFAGCTPVVRGGDVYQIHDMVAWREGDYYLSLYEYQPNPNEWDVKLAASRDGENWVFIKPSETVIRRGNLDDWDCDLISAAVPIRDNDEIKLYYGGICGGEWGRGMAGLATLRPDGYTNLQLAENRHAGSFTTIPIGRGSATQLVVNADCGARGYLEIELIDPATGRALPGYSREESVRMTGDSTAHTIEWKGKRDLSEIGTSPYEVRVYFEGAEKGFPKLYSLEFK